MKSINSISLALAFFISAIVNLSFAQQYNALNFDGTNDNVSLPSAVASEMVAGTAFTIEYWFKGSNIQSAVRMQSGSDYIIAGWSQGTPLHIISNDGGTSGISVGNTSVLYDGNWHHIAMVWEKNTVNGFRSYLDGSLVEQRNSADVNPPVITSGCYLGSFNGSSEFMNGSLDEVRIWAVARTQSELTDNANIELAGNETGLVAYYKLNEGVPGGDNSGVSSIADSKGSNNGTLNNFAKTGNSSNFLYGVVGYSSWYEIFSPSTSITGFGGSSPVGQEETKAIDNNTGTKYLNFGKTNTGFTCNTGTGSVARKIKITTADDSPERDPNIFVLAGSNDGTNFIDIVNSPIPCNSTRFFSQYFEFANSTSYSYYKVTFPDVCNAGTANSMQVAEVQLYGNKLTQTISFAALPDKATGDSPFNLNATASSGLSLTYTSSNPSVATISGNTVTIVGQGSSTITASQAGNVYYVSATAQQVLNVKASQSINFGILVNKVTGATPYNLSATASSGLTVSFSSSNPAVATVSGNTVTIVGGGSTQITASQTGDATYAPAPDVVRTLTVSEYLSNCLDFDGVNDYVDIPGGAGLKDMQSGTIEMWVKWNGLQDQGANGYGCTCARQYNGSFSNQIISLSTDDPATAKVMWLPYGGSVITGNTSVGDGNWVHVAVVYASGNHKLYINGILDGTASTTGSINNSAVPSFTIGAWSGDGNGYMKGKIDEVRIWSSQRTQDEIISNAGIELNGTETGLVSYYKFNQGTPYGDNTSISQITDSKGTNHGTWATFAKTGTSSNFVTFDGLAPQSISFGLQMNRLVGGVSYSLSASASSGLPVSYVSSNTSVATVSGSTVTIVGVGSTQLTASQNGDAFRLAAPNVVRQLKVVSIVENGLNFDGTNDNVSLPGAVANAIGAGTAFTIEYWFKGSSIQSAVRMQSGGDYIIAGWSNLHIISSDGGTSGISAGNTSIIFDGQWHHLAMVWEKNTSNGFRSYLDGLLVEQRNSANVNPPSISSGCYLGSFNGSSEFMNGSLDEVRIWTVARTQSELIDNACIELTGNPTGLAAYYKLNVCVS